MIQRVKHVQDEGENMWRKLIAGTLQVHLKREPDTTTAAESFLKSTLKYRRNPKK